MKDYNIKLLAFNNEARIVLTKNTISVNEICNLKEIKNIELKKLLANLVTNTTLVSSLLDDDQTIRFKLGTENNKGSINTYTDSTGTVRGYLTNSLLEDSKYTARFF